MHHPRGLRPLLAKPALNLDEPRPPATASEKSVQRRSSRATRRRVRSRVFVDGIVPTVLAPTAA